jgi:hypothetical protein
VNCYNTGCESPSAASRTRAGADALEDGATDVATGGDGLLDLRGFSLRISPAFAGLPERSVRTDVVDHADPGKNSCSAVTAHGW